MKRNDVQQELLDEEDKGDREKDHGEQPVETIRRMNPGAYIPTGAELAAALLGDNDK